MDNLLENTCRLCSEEKIEMFEIFGDEGKQRNVAQKLRVCLPIMVYKTDPLPKQICQFCAARLDDVFEFREYCLKVYKQMHIKLLTHKHKNEVKIFLDAMTNSPDPCQAQLCMLKPRAPPPLVPLPLPLPSPTVSTEARLLKEIPLNIEPLPEIPCEVQIKEEPSDPRKPDEGSISDDRSLENDLEMNSEINSDSYGEEENNTEKNNTETESKTEKRTSILEQVLTGNLTARMNDCKDLPSKSKLTSKWWCSPCNNYYRTKEGLMKHMQLFCPRKYTCGKCFLVFKTVEELAQHEGTDHLKISLDFEESVKQCHDCDREFISWEMLKHHRLRDHLAGSMAVGTDTWCPLCNRFFPNIDLYRSHAQLHISGEFAEVPGFAEIQEMPNSVKIGGDLEEMKREHFIKSIRSLTCPTCGKVCTQQSALSNHMRTHEPKKHKCEDCGRSFGLLIRLETHRMSEHNQKSRSSPVLTSVEQEEALNAEREAREAREAKLRGRTYNEIMDSGDVLLDDQPPLKKSATQVKNSSKNVARCGICEQWFNDHTTMLNHLQTHSDNLIVKNFTCSVCRKSFREKWQLQRHEISHKRGKNSAPEEEQDKVHIVDKTFHCQKCNKIFFKEFSLVTHQCMNQKRFKCPKCLTFFGTWQARASHMRLHSPERVSPQRMEVDDNEPVVITPETSPGTSVPSAEPKIEVKTSENPPVPMKRTLIRTANGYRCGVCQSPFVLRELAVAHLRSAHPVMPYQCPYCKKRFTTQYTFTHHIKTDHPNESEK